MVVINSTITGNSAGFAEQGGGIYTEGHTMTLTRTIVSGNDALDGPEISLDTTTPYADAGNVIGYGGSARCDNWAPGSGDIVPVGPLSSVLDPLLSDNGGPMLTHALVADSPAIDVASSGPATDQRGYVRPVGAGYDAGAVEFGAGVPTAVGQLALNTDLRSTIAPIILMGLLAGLSTASGAINGWRNFCAKRFGCNK